MNTHSTAKSCRRILFIGLKNDYGDPRRGLSFEYVNFFESLSRMENVQAELFPFDEIMRAEGREKMNARLLGRVADLMPDISLFFLFTDEIKKETIRTITARGDTRTLNWFADDHWRFSTFSRYWAPLFHWVITTDSQALEKYARIGCRNVIHSQWGFNHHFYRPVATAQDLDVTFVGRVHSNRRSAIRALQRSGIDVACWGRGWPNGRLSQSEMNRLYSRSRINLNFAESSFGLHVRSLIKVALSRRADDTYHFNGPREIAAHISTLFAGQSPQIKGRNFEIPGAGGFLLSQNVAGLEEFFVPGKEIAVFDSEDELSDKIRYFLLHDAEREAIRRAGYIRSQNDHTLERRLERIIAEVLR